MEELHSLLHSFTCAEWASFRNYLPCFTTYNSDELKLLQLADILIGAKEAPTHDACCIKLYGRKNDHCFDELKSDLKGKALDFLLTDISCDKQKELDEADYAAIKIKKKSAQFNHLFYSKKRIPLLYDLLDEIIHTAKEYELYAMLVEHLRLKKIIISPKSSKKEFEKINKEMDYYWDCNRMVNKAEHYYYELIILGEYSGKTDEEGLTAFFEKAIAEVEEYYEHTKSPLINYHKKFLEVGFYQHRKNYLKARSVCLELLDVVNKNKSVYRRQRSGVVYDNLSRCELYLAFSMQSTEDATAHSLQALNSARQAQECFNLNSENHCIALEQELYALFAMKQYDVSIEIANKMLASATRKELGEFRHSKYNYLLANALFKERRFTEAHNLLQENSLSTDKAGWATGARILKIMTLIEMLKLDEASLAVHSLKKHFSRTDKETPIRARDKKILNLLLLAERKGFMFTMLNGSTEKYLAYLTPPHPPEGGNTGDTCSQILPSGGGGAWEPFTHEVIPFHEWFAGKMGKSLRGEPMRIQKREREKVISR